MPDLAASLRTIALESRFSGAIRVDLGGDVLFAEAFGLADRAAGIANRLDTRFGIASATKGLTALTIERLIERGDLARETTARSLLGSDLGLIDDGVTVEHLLAHRSGIGDYLDEDLDRAIDDYVLTVPVHELATTEQFLRVLDGFPQQFPPGERFSYCNGGYVVLALLAERATGRAFHDLVAEEVCDPAGMTDTEFLRSDELPGRAALGYLAIDGFRTNVFHLPVRGNGDGGISSTLADVHALWAAMFSGRIVPVERIEAMVAPRSEYDGGKRRHGLGFWLAAVGPTVELEGYDAGVSFRSAHDPERGLTYTVVSNTSEGAWPIARHLRDVYAGS